MLLTAIDARDAIQWPATYDRARPVSSIVTWTALALSLAACLPTMLIDLGGRNSTSMEEFALVSSQETWLRQQSGERHAWLLPSLNGNPRVVKPPMVVWLHMLAWSDLDPDTSSVLQLIERARLMSVALTLVLLASTFWIGVNLGGRHLAVLASVIAGSMFFLQRQGRTASYDIHLASWSTLAIASALWAMRPTGPRATRFQQFIGWSGAGLGLAMAWMSKGPLAIALVGLPVLGFIAFAPGRRVLYVLKLCGSIALATALVAPWYIYVWHSMPGLMDKLQRDYGLILMHRKPIYYYLELVVLVIPWTLWLLIGLLIPFRDAMRDRRRQVIGCWVWFVLLFLLFSIPAAKQQRYILPIIPAVALLAAHGWAAQWPLSRSGRAHLLETIPLRMHWTGLIAGSFLFAPLVVAQGWVIEHGWLPRESVAPLRWPHLAGISVLLISLAFLGWRWHARGHATRAALTTAAWALVLCSIFWRTPTPSGAWPYRAQAERIARIVRNAPLHYLRLPGPNHAPDLEFLLFTRRVVRPVRPEKLVECAATAPCVYVMADSASDCDDILRDSSFIPITDFRDGRRYERRLWQHAGPETDVSLRNSRAQHSQR